MNAKDPPRLVIVVAMAENRVIGREGGLPWRLPSDLRHFRAVTMGKPVLMGRRTYEGIGRPLDGRTNIVISRDPSFAPAGITVVSSLDDAVEAGLAAAKLSGAGEVAVIGGGTVYAALIPRADRLYVTHVAASPEGDTHFPAIVPEEWELVSREPGARSERDSADMSFAVYDRRNPARGYTKGPRY